MELEKLKTVREIHRGFREKKLKPSELVETYLKRIKNSTTNSYITVTEELAKKSALEADALLEKSLSQSGALPEDQPLFGIPLGIKDALTTESVRTTAGSQMLENYIPPYSATCLRRLWNSGAILLGKLNMDEFAMGGSNENSFFGPVQHPTHPGHVPGGSSGGSSAAVREGLCFAALGSDTGGSVRLPASYCGIVGLKPSYGKISRYGLIAFASSLDQVGPMTQTTEDAALMLEVMTGHDPRDATSFQNSNEDHYAQTLNGKIDWSSLRIGIPKEYWSDGIQGEVLEKTRDAVNFFEKKGAKIVDVSLPHTQYSVAVYYIVAVSEASSNLARMDGVRFGMRDPKAATVSDLTDFYELNRQHFGAEVKRRILLGTFALSSGYYDAYYRKACQVRRLIADDFTQAFQKCDVIMSPVAPTTAYKIGEQISDPLKMYLNDILTIPANLAGLPGVSVPCGTDGSGLPIGLQILGKFKADTRILQLGHAYEARARGEE